MATFSIFAYHTGITSNTSSASCISSPISSTSTYSTTSATSTVRCMVMVVSPCQIAFCLDVANLYCTNLNFTAWKA